MTVSVPTVLLQGHKTITLKKVAKRNIDILSTTQPTFSGLAVVEHKQSARKIEIQGNLDVNKPGCYQLVYSYKDDPKVKKVVSFAVKDTTSPVLEFLDVPNGLFLQDITEEAKADLYRAQAEKARR